MSARWAWAVVPLLAGLGTTALYEAMGFSQALLNVVNVAVFLVAAAGSAMAASAFARGDYLRLAWALMALCYVLLLFDTVLFGAASAAARRDETPLESTVSMALTIAANLATVLALLRVARAWKVAGLDLHVSRPRFWGSIAVVVALSSALLGKEVITGFVQLASGDFSGGTSLASSLGDITATAVLVPLLLTALSLRGGSLAWPWSLLTASTLLWLTLDVVMALGGTEHGVQLASTVEGLRVAACLFQFTAGVAQRASIR